MVYWDTSALVSLYVPDIHSAAAAKALTGHSAAILFTGLHELELTNAIALRVFRREITPLAARQSLAALASDRRQGLFVDAHWPESCFATAGRLAERTTSRLGCRSLDLLHVAAALELQATGFLTFDKRQRSLARAGGLSAA
ncbi:MAG TPA: type II toxin-antitoxin system VapC family toxin [Terriglobales bacterium]|nr:type II toxin-antitoxin system VapC family toxin [Terriglobales bacterium]